MDNQGYSEEADFAEKERVLADIEHWLPVGNHKTGEVRALEIGGAGALLSGLFASRQGHVICTDVADWNSQYSGEFLKLVSEKFQRNHRAFDISKLQLLMADAQDLCFRDGYFDVVFSLNAFEHIPDPLVALAEAIRVTRSGGLIYISFDPVWTADSGSHFLHRISEPWAHLLTSDREMATIMSTNGASSDEIDSYFHHMNRLGAAFYRDNFPEVIAQCGAKIIHQQSWSGVVEPDHLHHENLATAAHRMEAPVEDLLVRGFQFVMIKD